VLLVDWVLQIIAAILTLLFLCGMVASFVAILVTAIDFVSVFESNEPKPEHHVLPTSQQRREERRKAIRVASAPPTALQQMKRRFQQMVEFLHAHAPRHHQRSH
jgi:Na+-transporting methylmalonyl-CoA/oxaloacetate decarboxylase gamma subunit